MNVELVSLVGSIPSTFWGVVIGAFFALGGVHLTNRASDRRLKLQLEHDRTLKNVERELALRKDIYLAAAEAISEGLRTVLRFPDLLVSNRDLMDRYAEKAASVAKIHVVAKEETVNALSVFMSELEAAFLRLWVKRYPLMAQKERIDTLARQADEFGGTRDQMVELMRQHNIDGSNDPRRIQVLQGNFDFEQKRVAKSIEEQQALGKDLATKAISYFTEAYGEYKKLMKLLVPVVVAVRAELELPIDGAVLEKMYEENVQRHETELTEFFAAIRK
jgi:hypothetical protein